MWMGDMRYLADSRWFSLLQRAGVVDGEGWKGGAVVLL